MSEEKAKELGYTRAPRFHTSPGGRRPGHMLTTDPATRKVLERAGLTRRTSTSSRSMKPSPGRARVAEGARRDLSKVNVNGGAITRVTRSVPGRETVRQRW